MTPIELNNILLKFSQFGQLSVVKEAIRQGANVHAKDDLALCWAAEYGHLDIVKFLLKNGADIHACDDLALRWAARYGHQDIVNYLKLAA